MAPCPAACCASVCPSLRSPPVAPPAPPGPAGLAPLVVVRLSRPYAPPSTCRLRPSRLSGRSPTRGSPRPCLTRPSASPQRCAERPFRPQHAVQVVAAFCTNRQPGVPKTRGDPRPHGTLAHSCASYDRDSRSRSRRNSPSCTRVAHLTEGGPRYPRMGVRVCTLANDTTPRVVIPKRKCATLVRPR